MIEANQAAESQRLTLIAQDGMPIVARVFEPCEAVDMTVLAMPGIGAPQRVFRHLGHWLAQRGARCLTLNYRGMGESKQVPEAAQTASLTTWARQDAVAALAYAEQHWPEPVVLLGHSFGGQLLGLADAFQRVRAAVLIGSQFGQSRHWDGRSRLWIMAYWYLMLPVACALFETIPPWTGLGTSLPRGVGQEWSKWGRSKAWFVSCEPQANATFQAFSRPILAYAIGDDNIAPPRAVSALLERFNAAQVSRRDVQAAELGLRHLGHIGLLRPGPTEDIWNEILTFFQQQIGV